MKECNLTEFYIHLNKKYGNAVDINFVRNDNNINIKIEPYRDNEIFDYEFKVSRTNSAYNQYHITVYISYMEYWMELIDYFSGKTLVDYINPAIQIYIPAKVK